MPGGANGKGASGEPRVQAINAAPRAAPAAATALQQEGCYVCGVIEAREPMTFGRLGVGGAGEMVYAASAAENIPAAAP
jgi:hypothetical protein